MLKQEPENQGAGGTPWKETESAGRRLAGAGCEEGENCGGQEPSACENSDEGSEEVQDCGKGCADPEERNGGTKAGSTAKKRVPGEGADIQSRLKREKRRLLKEQLLLIERELKVRREGDALSRYNAGKKVHRKQLAFHKCKKRNRWVFGGNRSGKTECGAVEAVWLARGIHPYRKNRADVSGWVVSLSQQVQRDVAQAKLLRYLRSEWIEEVVMQSGRKGACEYGVIDYILVRNVFGGVSRIGFKSCDQGREKFQGASLDFVWFDEEPPKDIYDECRMRVMDRKGEIFGTMTPLKGLTFLYDEIFLNVREDPQAWYIQMEWADNPFLSKEEIAALESTMDERTLASRRYGRFDTGSGLVYGEFDPEVHVIEPFDVPHEWYDQISIDPGLKNPLACHFYACDWDGNLYAIAEHYEAERDVRYHAERIREIAERLGWHFDGQGRLRALIDSAASQRTLAASQSVAELFYDQGILVDTNVNKDMFSGISRVKQYLKGEKHPRLYIFKNCVHLIREFKGYWWGEGDHPRKQDDHCLDELRYYVMSRPQAPVRKVELTPIQRDKERLARLVTRRNRGRRG